MVRVPLLDWLRVIVGEVLKEAVGHWDWDKVPVGLEDTVGVKLEDTLREEDGVPVELTLLVGPHCSSSKRAKISMRLGTEGGAQTFFLYRMVFENREPPLPSEESSGLSKGFRFRSLCSLS